MGRLAVVRQSAWCQRDVCANRRLLLLHALFCVLEKNLYFMHCSSYVSKGSWCLLFKTGEGEYFCGILNGTSEHMKICKDLHFLKPGRTSGEMEVVAEHIQSCVWSLSTM